MKNKFQYAIDVLKQEIIELQTLIKKEKNELYVIKYNINIEQLNYAINLLTIKTKKL